MHAPNAPESARRAAGGTRRAGAFTGFVAALAVAAAATLVAAPPAQAAADRSGPPPTLAATGLYASGSSTEIRAGNLSFSPQYPLWSDGAAKRRWIRLPSGAAIDARDPDAFVFPPGTRLWKEFSFGGRRIETRYIERRADGRWDFATYRWNAQGSDAVLVPAGGERGLAVAEAPGGRYELPSRNDCLACHDGAAVPVLGFGALQLSTDRDAGAAHAVAADPGDLDLRKLAERGLLRGLPRSLRESPPRIAAATATERAALGYLHGNCGACHNDDGAPAPVRLVLAQRVADAAASRHRMLQTTVGVTARLQPAAAAPPVQRIAPGLPDDSLLLQRMRSRHAALQMPPLGTAQPDPEGLALIERWIANDLTHPKEH